MAKGDDNLGYGMSGYEGRVKCALCGALPGEPCRANYGHGMKTSPHTDRIRRADDLFFREHPERRRDG